MIQAIFLSKAIILEDKGNVSKYIRRNVNVAKGTKKKVDSIKFSEKSGVRKLTLFCEFAC